MNHAPAPEQPAIASLAVRILDMSYTGLVNYRALYAFANLRIADRLKDEQLLSDEIARSIGAHPRALYRLLRTLSNSGVVSESPDHRFALTPLGRLLRSDVPGSMRAWVIFSGDPAYLRAWEQILHSVHTGGPSWNYVHGISFFEYLRQNSETAHVFDQAMTSLSQGEALTVTAAYDFSSFRRVVDVGGGHGTLLATILNANPGLRGVLFDQPQVAEAARKHIADAGLTDRCEIVGGDFFEAVPVGGDVYIMKYIVHDWDDEHSLRLLNNCRRAMTADARLLVIETVVPAPGEPHFAKVQDLEMLILLGSQERTLEEYAALLAGARFRVSGATPTEEPLSVVEAVPI